MRSVVRVSGLTQGYGRDPVISGLDLELGPGITGLLGPNGAGKSTLLRTLATVTPPLEGEVHVLGEHVRSERTARAARREIGYLPQDFGYFGHYSVHDFVRYCAWLREVPSARIAEATRTALRRVGLAERSGVRMRTLSGGMIRRAGIAAAVVGSPALVLLDEPTVGLDPAQRLEFRELVRSLDGSAVVLSTHLVEDVAAVCERVLVLDGGSVRFTGTPAELAERAVPEAPGDTELERGYMAVLGAAPGAMGTTATGATA
ncbi:ABC transporter ATP-binding protein [Streptomyces calidiresistens]|uniref:ATP-binding cassette domain-containing protein n=1 Tax=Streptomyces calidiresistens TaxID=1485586 RepID=A0A7W3T1F5_9ACTN|nr:ATP-binding cassette domain-containing protein [Streptomyces calidiresistens]MBB0229185.1 ATP-binding cassette domain-containing protein [Streptomyces calidiresistens]